MSQFGPGRRLISHDVLLADLRRVAVETGSWARATYAEFGRFHETAILLRFGTWTRALTRAGLSSETHLAVAEQAAARRRRIRVPHRCLKCERLFSSWGPANRLCKRCQMVNAGIVEAV